MNEIDGTNAAESLFGTAGADSIFGYDGNDTIFGGGDNDLLYGGGGSDLLFGEAGSDEVHGGAQDDQLTGGDGNDLLDGGSGQDTATYDYLTVTGVVIDLQTGVASAGSGDTDSLVSIEIVRGSAQSDTITGSSTTSQIFGADGDDYIDDRASAAYAHQISGGAGNDTIYDSGSGLISGDAGNDHIFLVGTALGASVFGGEGDDVLVGGSPASYLSGQDGADVLTGGGSNDTLAGGTGNDVLTGGAGGDIIFGGDGYGATTDGGDDLFRDTAANLNGDSYYDLAGKNRLQVTDVAFDAFTYTRSGSYVTLASGSTLFVPSRSHFIIRAADDGGTLIKAASRIINLADFDGNGHSDILWRSSAGEVTTWQVSGNIAGNQLQVNSSYTSGIDPAWQIKETLDYNGDGRSDLLWQNTTTGDISISAASSTGNGFIRNAYNASIGADWKIAAVGDFNGDGLDDMVFRQDGGTFSIWQSNQYGFNVNVTFDSAVSADWKIVGSGDFDGDGKSDILWRNASSGAFSEWSAAGGGDFDPNTFFNTQVDLSWHIDGIADFNGDGRDDVLWRHDGDGVFTVWQSIGHNFTPNAYVDTSVAPVWQVQTTGDYNDDGKADILWRNTASGDFSIWQSNGNGFDPNTAYVSGVGTNWQVQGHSFQFG